jgi:hypothetical protein
MPLLTQEHIQALHPLIDAFEGHPSKTQESHLLEGERHNNEYLDLIHDGRDNGRPTQFHNHLLVTEKELTERKIDKGNPYPLKCFLWVIDSTSLRILWEMTPNILRKESRPDKPYVCHTNITGNSKAYIGGEMYFCENGNIYVNFLSDRYGVVATEEKKRMAIKYMEDCKYKNVIRTDQYY